MGYPVIPLSDGISRKEAKNHGRDHYQPLFEKPRQGSRCCRCLRRVCIDDLPTRSARAYCPVTLLTALSGVNVHPVGERCQERRLRPQKRGHT